MDRVIYVPYNIINAVGKDQIKDNIKNGVYGCLGGAEAVNDIACRFLSCSDCILKPANYTNISDYTIEIYYPPKE